MSVYVDELWYRCHGVALARSCHLMADSDRELAEFAKRLGLPKSWKHGDHYDLTPSRRAKAIRFGAEPITTRAMVLIRQRLRGSKV